MGTYNTYNIRRMDSFAEAKKHFDSVTPIRGNPDRVKPLGMRRYWNMANISMPDTDTVNLGYGWHKAANKLVEWKPDNTFTVFRPTHVNAYGPDTMTPYLPMGCAFQWNLGRLFIVLPGNKRYMLTPGQEMRFQIIDRKIFALNKPVAYSYRVRRVPLARVMKEYEPFLSWLQVVLAVSRPFTDEEIKFPYYGFAEEAGVKPKSFYADIRNAAGRETDEARRSLIYSETNNHESLPFRGRGSYGANSNFHKPSCELLHEWVTDTSAVNWARAMYVIAKQGAESRYVFSHNPGLTYTLTVSLAQQYLRHLGIFLNRDEVLEKVRLDDGEVPSKRNTNYFAEVRFVL